MFRILVIAFFLLFMAPSAFSQAAFYGRVLSENSSPLQGVTIRVLNTSFGTSSDAEGNFTLTIPPGRYQLKISAIGYAVLEQTVDVTNQTTPITIQMKEASTQLDAVVVTAQKVEEANQHIPVSISAINANQIQQYRIWNIQDVTAIAPNLYSANPGDNRNVTSIRGITNTSYDPSVATYIDGVNQFGLDTYITQLLDVERIEVLRGPQGTLYGRNAMGGVINIITKQPSQGPAGFAELNIGNYGQQRYAFGFRTAIKEKMLIGFSGMYEGTNGFYTNEYDNTDFDKKQSGRLNYFMKYTVNSAWSVALDVKMSLNRNNGAFPLAVSMEDAIANPFEVNQNAVSTMVDNLCNVSFLVNYTGQKFNFSAQTSNQLNYRYYKKPIDGDFSPIDGVSIINNYGNDWNAVQVFNSELKFTSPATATKFKWTAGAYAFYQYNPVKQAVYFGEDAALVGAPDTFFSVINATKSASLGVAAYGQGNYSITDRFDLFAGIRLDYEDKNQQVKGEYQKDPDILFETVPDTSASASFYAFSPKVGVAWRVKATGNLYLTYSRGFRAGGLTQLSLDPSQPALYIYDPEYSNTLEAGFKEQLFNNRLRLNTSVFYIKATDVQVPTLILPEAITVTQNAGELVSTGAELELSAALVKKLQVEYSVGYTNARYTTLEISQNGESVNLKDNRQLFTPDITSMLAVQLNQPWSKTSTVKLVVRGEWMYVGDVYFDLANQLKQPGYHLFNTRFGVQHSRFELMGWIRNLTDKRYISYAYDFGAAHMGNPQTYGITCSARF